ncbi:hypothetical protein [Baaleninema sp.]|uniref:hypothetical protein n=1 Tax=Baaleninema sp. TaxID=3101197 RepID=UPI003D02679F
MKRPIFALFTSLALAGSLLTPSVTAETKGLSDDSTLVPQSPTRLISQHTDRLPRGRHHFYERDLEAMVSYIREGNYMYGALYDRSSLVCFSADINWGSVDVNWWGDLWRIGNPNRSSMSVTYSIDDFTVGNSTVRPGLDNPSAVWRCH